MNGCKLFCSSILLTFALLPLGCVHAARDTTGFAQNHEIVVAAPFDTTWQSVKAVLREKELDLYTRDKRGQFVAYTPEKRHFLQPKRYKYTFELESISDTETRIALDTRKQAYGVTLLTYPGWHDRKTPDAPESQALLDAIQARATTAPAQ
jgi:hypothetical protein